jgi:hypothetical protein
LLAGQIVEFNNAIDDGLIKAFELLFRGRHFGLKRNEPAVDGGGAVARRSASDPWA